MVNLVLPLLVVFSQLKACTVERFPNSERGSVYEGHSDRRKPEYEL